MQSRKGEQIDGFWGKDKGIYLLWTKAKALNTYSKMVFKRGSRDINKWRKRKMGTRAT